MDSRFLHLLESNIVPAPLEVVAIQAEVERLTSKTHPTQHDPELEATLGRYRGILSPVRQIPSEIWGEIFYFATPAVVSGGDKDDLVSLYCVSSAWHEAALHAHALWANIELAPLPEGKKYIYNNLVSWLARSGDLKKGLEYKANVWEDYDHEDDNDDPTEQGFCPCHSGRSCMWMEDPVVARFMTEGPLLLHRVSFGNMYPRCIGNAMRSFQLAKSGLPSTQPWNQIQELELRMHTDCWQGWWDESADSFKLPFRLIPSSVTSLLICLPPYGDVFDTELECQRAKIDIAPAVLGHLTSLVLVCEWGPLHIVTLLQHCSNLETFRLEFGHPGYADRPSYADKLLLNELDNRDPMIRRVQVEGGIQLPKLHTLQVYDGHASPILFLQWIQTPALRFLDLETTGSYGNICPNWTEALDDFVTRSGCARSIQSLRLASDRHTFSYESDYLRYFNEKTGPFLSSLSSLKYLTFCRLPIVPVLRTDFQNIEDPSNHVAHMAQEKRTSSSLQDKRRGPFLNTNLTSSKLSPAQAAQSDRILKLALSFWLATVGGKPLLYPLSVRPGIFTANSTDPSTTVFGLMISRAPSRMAELIQEASLCSPEEFVQKTMSRMQAFGKINSLPHLSHPPDGTVENNNMEYIAFSARILMKTSPDLGALFSAARAPEQFMQYLAEA
ncbi:hypothetical protein DFP72DRAFT_1091339 [Ephemerocybe angulata]|uniref:F-box domain-containing protein n=1 Tax=Ephemerocybe angulata TaxID=980116 RepID=A0A8H6HFP7_9AGAR|nr:hypothetical protein DFP72DRAFT_1091339 [Tulosesus angulatus]